MSLCVYEDKGYRTDVEKVGFLTDKDDKATHKKIGKTATAQANETACHHTRRHESQHAIPQAP